MTSSVQTPPLPLSPMSAKFPRYSSAMESTSTTNKHKTWKEAGVYGLLDADALADDMDNDEEEKISEPTPETDLPTPPSPTRTSPGRSRLRNSKMQWTTQGGLRPQYVDFGTNPDLEFDFGFEREAEKSEQKPKESDKAMV